MLIKLHSSLKENEKVTIKKTVEKKDVSTRGAFAHGTVIDFSVTVPRTLGAAAVVLRIAADGGAEKDIPMQFFAMENAADVYALSLDTKDLCGEQKYGEIRKKKSGAALAQYCVSIPGSL